MLNINFDFSQEGQEKLLKEIIELEDELKKLSEEMMRLPIEEVVKKNTELKMSLQGLKETAMAVNQNNKDAGKVLAELLAQTEKQSEAVGKSMLAYQAASKTLEDFKRELKANESIIQSTVKSLEEWRVGTYKGKKSIEELSATLISAKMRYSELSETIKLHNDEIRKEIGYYENLKLLVKDLTASRDALIASEGKEAKGVQELTALIQKYNIELQVNNREINALNNATSLLHKTEEAITRVLNTDAEATSRLVVVKAELKDAVNQILGVTLESNLAKKQQLQLDLKELEMQPQSIENLARIAILKKEISNLTKQEIINQTAEQGSIAELRLRLSQLTQEYEKLGLAARFSAAGIAQAKDIVNLKNELIVAQREIQGTTNKLGILTRIWDQFGRTLIRAVPTLIIYGLLFAALSKLWDLFTLGTKKTQEARKELEGYTQALRDAANEAVATSAKESSHAQNQIDIATDVNLAMYKRVDAINELRKAYKGLFEDYSNEEMLTNKSLDGYKKLDKAIILQATIKANEKEIELAATRGATAQNEITDLEGVKNRAEDYRKKRMTELENSGRINFRSPIRNKETVEYANLKKGIVSVDNLFENNAEGRLEKERLQSRSVYDKIFDDGSVNVNEQSGEIEKRKKIVESSKRDIEEFRLKAQTNSELLNNLVESKKKNIIELKAKLASLKTEIDSQNLPQDITDLIESGTDDINGTKLKKLLKSKGSSSETANTAKLAHDYAVLDKQIKILEKEQKEPRGRHTKNRELEDTLADEKQYHRKINELQRESYDNSDKSFDDKKDLYQEEDEEAERHYKKQISIIEQFGKISGESEKKLSARKNEAFDEMKKDDNRRSEERQRDLLDMQRYNERQLKIIEEIDNKLSKQTEETRKYFEDSSDTSQKNKIKNTGNKRFNVLGALLGIGGGNSVKDFRDSITEKDLDIARDKANVKSAGDIFSDKDIAVNLARQNSEKDNEIPDNKKTPSQLLSAANNRDILNKAVSERSEAEKKYQSLVGQLNKDSQGKQEALDLRTRDGRVKLAQSTFDMTEKIANSSFEIQKKRIAMQMQNVENLANFEMTLAGNNSSARIRIATREHAEMLTLKRKAANAEKNQAIFSATIETAKGVASALAVDPPLGFILAGVVAAAGLKQISDISNSPLPSYRIGRGPGKKERARINEEGLELVTNDAKVKIFGGGKEAIANLEAGDTVHTHSDSMRMIESDKFLKSLLFGTGVVAESEKNNKNERIQYIREGLSKKDYKNAMVEALQSMPPVQINLPAQGLSDKLQRQQLRNGL